MHEVAPARLNVFAGQGVEMPSVHWWPSWHCAHDWLPALSALNCPGGHGSQFGLPRRLNSPAAHSVLTAPPGQAYPDSHTAQDALPFSWLNFPGAHLTQELAFPALNWPASQGSHTTVPMDVVVLEYPGSHSEHFAP